MNRGISIGLLVAGIILLGYGLNSGDSAGSHVSKFFTGAPTDKAIWLQVGGVVAAVAGLFGLVRGR